MSNELVDSTEKIADKLLNAAIGNKDLLALQQKAAYASGARTKLKINGKLVGFCFEVSWRIDTIQEEIRVIDDYMAQELAPKMISVEGTLGSFHIPGKGPTAELWQPDVKSFLFHKYITIEVRDQATDELLLYVPKATIISRSESIKSENLATLSLKWKALSWKDEVEPELPKGYKDKSESEPSPTASVSKFLGLS